MKKLIILCLITFVAMLLGCGGGGSSSHDPVAPAVVKYVSLNGTLTAPTTLNSTLLGNTLSNTDRETRLAFASATVYVNNNLIKSAIITPYSSTPDWNFSLAGVPESSTGIYKIKVVTGKICLQSWVSENNKDNFKINLKTTATALLARETGKKTDVLLASYSSFINKIEKNLFDASNIEAASITGNITNAASVSEALASDKDFFSKSIDFVPEAQVAYLGRENDLDGDGIFDLKISQTVDGNRIRFFTDLSSSTTMMENIASISQYTDARLLQDFKDNLGETNRTFDTSTNDVALGIYMKKSAFADIYLKLFIKRIDIVDGSFKGVVAEYSFVKTKTTAIASGTKTIMLSGVTPTIGAVKATDFVSDSDISPYLLTYISKDKGLGCGSGNTPMVRAIDGKPKLTDLSYAEKYAEGGGNYFSNTKIAMQKIYKTRPIEEGDVFSAYFPRSKNYALFKIIKINENSIIIDYIVNVAEDENAF